MHETGHSNPVYWDNPEGWDREEVGGGIQDGGGGGDTGTPWFIHVDVWQKPPQYFKVISLQLK